MDAQRIVTDLLAAGVRQVAIASAIGLDQSGVSRIVNGERSRLSYDVAERLLELHRTNADAIARAKREGSPA